jgi:hypothetical protein
MKFCDYDCEHASFPDERMLGACRTQAGVFCRKLGRVVPRHVPCSAGAEGSEDRPRRRGGKGRRREGKGRGKGG